MGTAGSRSAKVTMRSPQGTSLSPAPIVQWLGKLDKELDKACEGGDLKFVSRCIAEGRDRKQTVIWDKRINTAYVNKHMDIVRCIRDSGRMSVDTKMYYSCLLGDLEFVTQCIAEDRDRGENTKYQIHGIFRGDNVDWEKSMNAAYRNNHMDVVECIRVSRRVSMLYYSCLIGDLEYVLQWVDENRDSRDLEDWGKLMTTAYVNKHMDIVRCIRDSGRVSIGTQLHKACRFGDNEFVELCSVKERDGELDVDWEELMETAYDNDHMNIVHCIRDSGQVSIDTQVHKACYFGDLEFVSQFIADDRDREEDVDWAWPMETAYDREHMDIVRCIRDSGRVPIDTQLYYSCRLDDLGFVAQCIARDRDRGQNVDWERLVETIYKSCMSIVNERVSCTQADIRNYIVVLRCIRNTERVSLYLELYYSCIFGDFEFVSQCIVEERDTEQDVDLKAQWETLIKLSQENEHVNIVRCIRDRGRVSPDTQLSSSCVIGDLEFVTQYIAEDRDRGQNVNWRRLMTRAYERKHMDTALVIAERERCTLADIVPSVSMGPEYDYDENITMFLIKHTADVNRELRPGINTLHVACYICATDWCAHANIISLALKKGGKVNQRGYMGRTPLHFLCHGQNKDVDNMIHNATKVEESNHYHMKKSKLYAGGQIREMNMTPIIEDMINSGAEVNATDDNGQTPLHLLCLSEEELDIAKYLTQHWSNIDHIGTTLLKSGADINKKDNEGRTPLAAAAQHGNRETISFLIKKGCDKNMENLSGQTPLYLSAVANSVNCAEVLCVEGVNVNQADAYNVTPLAAACEQGNHQIVDLLLKHGADPGIEDMEERTALHRAALCGSTESCKILMSKSIDLHVQDITGCTPLHLATTGKKLQIIQCLLEAGCSVNVENNLGNIALHNAASFYVEEITLKISKNITEILLQESEIDYKNNYGHTPIMLSANALNFTQIKLLYENKANLRVVNNMHRGLLHQVVENYPLVCLPKPLNKFQECQAIIQWLIENGLSINASDVNDQTPLHLAAQQGDLELVTFLVKTRSDVTARDSLNHMPLMNALEHPGVFQYLWEKTLPAITDDDLYKLQRLSYWLGIDGVIKKQINTYSPIVIDLANRPQNVRKLKLKYGDNLEKWLKTEKDELPGWMETWLPSLQDLTYIDHQTINNVMWEFLKDIENGVKKVDPLVAYIITRCGSVEEMTKAFAQDECDCSCVQQNIRFEMFEAPKEAGHPQWTAFVHLVCKDEYYDDLKRVLDGRRRLSQAKLCHFFGKAIGKVLADRSFWSKYPQLQRISAKDISAGDRRICTMHVIWSDEICPWLKIDIDLAPVIDLSKWKPSWCSQHPLLDEIDCIALPKWKMTPNVNMDLMEIGVHYWGPLFHKMPEEMRQGYRLAKVVRGSAVCPQIPQTPSEVYSPEGQLLDMIDRPMHCNNDTTEYEEWSNAGEFMNTYLLKQVIMHEYTTWYDDKMKGLNPPVHTEVYWARRIYEKMEEAFKHRELYSWFIPTYNLLTDDKFVQFQDTAVLYARLCRRLLTEEAADHFRKAYLGRPQGCHDSG